MKDGVDNQKGIRGGEIPCDYLFCRVKAGIWRKASSAPKLSSAVQVSQPQKIRSNLARSINSCNMAVADWLEINGSQLRALTHVRIIGH